MTGYHIVLAVSSKETEAKIVAMLNRLELDQRNEIVSINYDAELAAYIAEPACLIREADRKNNLINKLKADQEKMEAVYAQLSDEKSRDIFVVKLALWLDLENLDLTGFFIRNYSEAVARLGEFGAPSAVSESICYFNNDLFNVQNGMTLIDVGAYNGCSTDAFIEKCQENGFDDYRSMAFEPDPENFAACSERFAENPHVECLNYALHEQETVLRFLSSRNCSLRSSSCVSSEGDISVRAVPLDNFDIDHVSIIKADPPGLDIAIGVLKGARKMIARHKPTLIFPGYHSFDAIYEMPLAIEALFPGQYSLYLRHLSYSINETDVFAIPKRGAA